MAGRKKQILVYLGAALLLILALSAVGVHRCPSGFVRIAWFVRSSAFGHCPLDDHIRSVGYVAQAQVRFGREHGRYAESISELKDGDCLQGMKYWARPRLLELDTTATDAGFTASASGEGYRVTVDQGGNLTIQCPDGRVVRRHWSSLGFKWDPLMNRWGRGYGGPVYEPELYK